MLQISLFEKQTLYNLILKLCYMVAVFSMHCLFFTEWTVLWNSWDSYRKVKSIIHKNGPQLLYYGLMKIYEFSWCAAMILMFGFYCWYLKLFHLVFCFFCPLQKIFSSVILKPFYTTKDIKSFCSLFKTNTWSNFPGVVVHIGCSVSCQHFTRWPEIKCVWDS